MTSDEIIEALGREQRDAIELWRSLPLAAWDGPSLCPGWTVKDVVIHCIKGESDLSRVLVAGRTERASVTAN